MSELGKWFEAIEEDGKQRARSRESIRQKIAEKGEPKAVVVIDKEYDEELRMWPIDGGVVEILFRKGKADVDRIITHTDEFIDALVKSRK